MFTAYAIVAYTVNMTTRERLFDAARTIFEREGLPGLSMRSVARGAELSAMAAYRHFADKDALVDALTRDGFAAWETIVEGIDDADAMAWLKRVFEAYLDFALNDPHRFDAAFLMPAREARKYPDDFAARRSPAVTRILERIESARQDGRLGDAPPLEIALTLSALAQGLVSMHRAGRFASEDDFRRSYAMAIRRGVGGFLGSRRDQT